jgi:hypothetical protein
MTSRHKSSGKSHGRDFSSSGAKGTKDALKFVPGDIARQPVLSYSSTTGNNLAICKEQWTLHLRNEYGITGNFLETLVYHEFEEIEEPDWTTARPTSLEDDKALMRAVYMELFKERRKQVSTFEQDKPKMFAFMLARTSVEARHKLEAEPEMDGLKAGVDPLGLWKVMVKALSVSSTSSTLSNQKRALDNYKSLRQGDLSIGDYHQEFKRKVANMVALDVTPPSDKMQALDFIGGLAASKFADFSAQLENAVAMAVDKDAVYPNSAQAAYLLAANWKVARSSFASAKSSDTIASVTAFASEIRSHVPANSKSKSRGKGGKDKSPHAESSSSTVEKSDKKAEKAEKKTFSGECWNCGQPGHRQSDCPDKAIGMIGMIGIIGFTSSHSSIDIDEIGLDTMASCHIIRDSRLLTNIRRADRPVEITGIGGVTHCNMIGELELFGTAYYLKQSPANLLSFGLLSASGLSVKHSQKTDEFIVNNENLCFSFRKSRGRNVYVTDGTRLRKLVSSVSFVAESVQKSEFSVSQLVSSSIVPTVAGNEEIYTKRQVEAAKEARRISESLGNPGQRVLESMLDRGAIVGAKVTSFDLRRAYEIYGPSLSAVRGKTTRSKTDSIVTEFVKRSVSAVLTLHVDIMFVEGLSFLISVSTPLMALMVTFLSSKATEQMKDALFAQIGHYKSVGFKVTEVLTDGEGAVAKLTPELNQNEIRVNTTDAGSHVPLVEEKIRQVKNMVRGQINTLPYSLPYALLIWLVYFCVSRINLVPSSSTAEFISPREMMLGQKISLKNDLGYVFGELVEAHEQPQNTNGMQARTRPSIVLYPTNNRQGTWRLLALDTKKVIHRQFMTKMPMNQSTIDAMNVWASENVKKIGKDPIFLRGNRIIDFEDSHDSPITHTVPQKLIVPSDMSDYDPGQVVETETML